MSASNVMEIIRPLDTKIAATVKASFAAGKAIGKVTDEVRKLLDGVATDNIETVKSRVYFEIKAVDGLTDGKPKEVSKLNPETRRAYNAAAAAFRTVLAEPKDKSGKRTEDEVVIEWANKKIAALQKKKEPPKNLAERIAALKVVKEVFSK